MKYKFTVSLFHGIIYQVKIQGSQFSRTHNQSSLLYKQAPFKIIPMFSKECPNSIRLQMWRWKMRWIPSKRWICIRVEGFWFETKPDLSTNMSTPVALLPNFSKFWNAVDSPRVLHFQIETYLWAHSRSLSQATTLLEAGIWRAVRSKEQRAERAGEGSRRQWGNLGSAAVPAIVPISCFRTFEWVFKVFHFGSLRQRSTDCNSFRHFRAQLATRPPLCPRQFSKNKGNKI